MPCNHQLPNTQQIVSQFRHKLNIIYWLLPYHDWFPLSPCFFLQLSPLLCCQAAHLFFVSHQVHEKKVLVPVMWFEQPLSTNHKLLGLELVSVQAMKRYSSSSSSFSAAKFICSSLYQHSAFICPCLPQ